MIIDTHAHTVPGTMLDALKSEKRLFPSVGLMRLALRRRRRGT